MSCNPMSLEGRTILITGASSGIGRETALLVGELGARVSLVARNVERLSETASALDQTKGHVFVARDLVDVSGIPAWMKALAQETGPIHGLVHSAGVHSSRPIRYLTPDHLAEVMNVNLGAALGLVKGFCQKGVAATGGNVVFVSSVAGLVGQPGVSAYAASKGALVSVARSLAMELARDGLRVNCVAPGIVRTEMSSRMQGMLTAQQFSAIEALHPLGLGTTRDVASAIAFLLSGAARWITGTVLTVDGGYTAQ